MINGALVQKKLLLDTGTSKVSVLSLKTPGRGEVKSVQAVMSSGQHSSLLQLFEMRRSRLRGDALAHTLFTSATMATADGVMSAQVQSQGDYAHHHGDTWRKTGPGEPDPQTGEEQS